MKKLTLVKIGGNVINNKKALSSFLHDFSAMKGLKILVHGGGKKASELSNKLGLESTMIGGRRVTDQATLEIVTMVYAGLLNKNIVAELQSLACNSFGLSGADGNLIKSHKRIVKEIDYGFAGDIDAVNTEALAIFLEKELTPVLCAITHDSKGQLLNTNADTIASEVAKALSELYQVELIYCFEKNGVLLDVNDENSVIENIDHRQYEVLKQEGAIADGMLPKLENCFSSLQHGVTKVRIGKPELIADKGIKHSILSL